MTRTTSTKLHYPGVAANHRKAAKVRRAAPERRDPTVASLDTYADRGSITVATAVRITDRNRAAQLGAKPRTGTRSRTEIANRHPKGAGYRIWILSMGEVRRWPGAPGQNRERNGIGTSSPHPVRSAGQVRSFGRALGSCAQSPLDHPVRTNWCSIQAFIFIGAIWRGCGQPISTTPPGRWVAPTPASCWI